MSRETSSQTELPELPVKTPGAHSCVETSAEIREKARILEEQREERKKASEPGGEQLLKQKQTQEPQQRLGKPSKEEVGEDLTPHAKKEVGQGEFPGGAGVTTESAALQQSEEAKKESQVPPPPHMTGSVEPIMPMDYVSSEFREAMQHAKVRDIVPQLASIVIAKSSESIASVFKKLIDFKILSVPVLDVATNQYVAFIDILDILAFLVETLNLQQRANWPLLEDWMAQLQFQGSCMQLLQRSMRNPWYVIAKEQPLQVPIQLMGQYNLHRLAVSDLENNFYSVLTQSRIVNWIAQHIGEKEIGIGPIADLTVDDLKLGYRPVVSIGEDRLALDAFLLIHQMGVSGVAVMNAQNEIIGTVSVSDLKDIGFSANMFGKLFINVREFIQNKLEGITLPPVAYVTRNGTVRSVLELMKDYRIHRVFVVESEDSRRPCGVISTNDILELFSPVTPSETDTTESGSSSERQT